MATTGSIGRGPNGRILLTGRSIERRSRTPSREPYNGGDPIYPVANRTILVGMAATFAGLTVLLAVAGVVVNPLLLAVAVPFGVVTYLLWYHVSGKLRNRVRREVWWPGESGRERVDARTRAAGNRRSARRTARANGDAWGRSHDPRDRAPRTSGMSERDAYATLGLDPGADMQAVRAAYRERAKRLHPDSDDGDEEAFKRLTAAYEKVAD